MCIILKSNKVLIAKKDIVCWKLVYRNGAPLYHRIKRVYPFGGGMYHAYSLKGKPVKHIKIRTVNFSSYGRVALANEGIHSFRTLAFLRNNWARTSRFVRYDKRSKKLVGVYYNTVLRCVIPKGTEYVENKTQYCSTKVRVLPCPVKKSPKSRSSSSA